MHPSIVFAIPALRDQLRIKNKKQNKQKTFITHNKCTKGNFPFASLECHKMTHLLSLLRVSMQILPHVNAKKKKRKVFKDFKFRSLLLVVQFE